MKISDALVTDAINILSHQLMTANNIDNFNMDNLQTITNNINFNSVAQIDFKKIAEQYVQEHLQELVQQIIIDELKKDPLRIIKILIEAISNQFANYVYAFSLDFADNEILRQIDYLFNSLVTNTNLSINIDEYDQIQVHTSSFFLFSMCKDLIVSLQSVISLHELKILFEENLINKTNAFTINFVIMLFVLNVVNIILKKY